MAERGYTIRFHSFLKGEDINHFLGRGILEVAIGGDMPAISAVANHGAHVAGLVQFGFCSLVAKENMLLDDLEGKTIGYASGSSAHNMLLEALDLVGLTVADVDLIPMEVTEMADALADDKIDLFSAWEPIPTLSQDQYSDQVIIYRSRCTGYLYFSEAFFENHLPLVEIIVASEMRAVEWLAQREDNVVESCERSLKAAGELQGKPIRLSLLDCLRLARDDLVAITSVPRITKRSVSVGSRLHGEFEFLHATGHLPQETNWELIQAHFHSSIVDDLHRSRTRSDAPGESCDSPGQ